MYIADGNVSIYCALREREFQLWGQRGQDLNRSPRSTVQYVAILSRLALSCRREGSVAKIAPEACRETRWSSEARAEGTLELYGKRVSEDSEYTVVQEDVRTSEACTGSLCCAIGRPRRGWRSPISCSAPFALPCVCSIQSFLRPYRLVFRSASRSSRAALDLRSNRVASTPLRRSSLDFLTLDPLASTRHQQHPTPSDREKDGATSTQARSGVARPLGRDCSVRRPVGQHHRGRRRIRSQVSRPRSSECLRPAYIAG